MLEQPRSRVQQLAVEQVGHAREMAVPASILPIDLNVTPPLLAKARLRLRASFLSQWRYSPLHVLCRRVEVGRYRICRYRYDIDMLYCSAL